ncbi:MAG TPA: cytochrome c oxidase subunit 4 [Candidatus Acidoferrales bacterium]|nr:cytochrome c oxidase subunit 4 [Candidatus Acidoferrales bacterium]
MIIGRRLFVSSATFSVVIATAYWFVAHEITGTFLLGFMAFALCIIAAYIYIAERDADLWGDQGDATMHEAAGQVVGTYSIRSPLPFWSGLAVTSILVGLVVSPTLAVLGFLATLGLGAAFILQSR